MDTFTIASQVENQLVQIDKASAVLREALDPFTFIKDWQYLPHYAEHISLLMGVTQDLILAMEPELRQVAEELYKRLKEEKAA